MKNKKFVLSKPFEKAFGRLPSEIRRAAYENLEKLLEDPSYPSLRVKKVRGTDHIWEMSVTMNYRITFEVGPESIYLRRIGTHDVLNHP